MSGADPRRRVLVFAPSSLGGLAEHVHYQASELARRGYDVRVLCRPDFCKPRGTGGYRQERQLTMVRGSSLAKRAARAGGAILDHYLLAWRILRLRPEFVLLEANAEYRAPAWFFPHWLLRLAGTVYVANFHDPLRGPDRGAGRWFAALNLRLAYAALSGGLLHGPPPPRAYLPGRLVLREAPFGPFTDLVGLPERFDLRARLGIARDASLVLAFGHVADRKNLDLLIAALTEEPDVHLVVAGRATSQRDRPLDFYRDAARRAGVESRVHFIDEFVAEADIPAYFRAADAVALTYAGSFVSQSGVLQIAALFDRPLLASGGDGPLRQTVERFSLGVSVAPDSAQTIAAGLRRLITEPMNAAPGFAAYRATTSWQANVDRLLEVVDAAKARKGP
ncbi:MAG: glycosyltransferase family 4 protein [Novosphingobium sp.]|nr:glycosyltransferase family 4 protein [Novosphingobium sp.]